MVGIVRVKPILQYIGFDKSYDKLPGNWNSLDVETFSKTKHLWRFQQDAIKNIIICLYLYFIKDKEDKKKFFQRYVNFGLSDELKKKLELKVSRDIRKISEEFFTIENGTIDFLNFINRMACWMATGSGKTLILVKIIEILHNLMESHEIPKKDILVLTYREDLLNQLFVHVKEFNELSSTRGFQISLVDLRDYEKIKFHSLVPFSKEFTIFYYRSDLFSQEQKSKRINFKNYENNGNWYVILDEAHKGVKKESKLQMFYSILSRNGFLFNFSATFTDPEDIVSTVYNFNLEKFIKEGYGKHIYLSQREITAFKGQEDYNEVEKQKIVLRALILLTYIKEKYQNVLQHRTRIYHEPLLLTLVNTVNLTDNRDFAPDLTLFFNEIEKIGNGDYDDELLNEVKLNISTEFNAIPAPFLIFENTPALLDSDLLDSINKTDILHNIFNSEEPGKIEVLFIIDEPKETILKLKTSELPFALIKIGNARKWIKDNLPNYEINPVYDNKSIFEELEDRKEFNILMGSRAFYEGWDSNRPNIILYINIGTQAKSKKFVLQSIGRGIRIEPFKDKRRRLEILHKLKQDNGIFPTIKDQIDPLETLHVFGTKKKVLESVLETLKLQGKFEEIELELNENLKGKTFLIPTFKQSEVELFSRKNPPKYSILEIQMAKIREYFENLDNRILLMANNLYPDDLSHIRESFQNIDKYYDIRPEKTSITSLTPLNVIIPKLVNHFSCSVPDLDTFRTLDKEINHFKKIQISYETDEESDEFNEAIANALKTHNVQKYKGDIEIKHIENHYFTPLIYSVKGELDYIKHVIKVEGEVEFLNKLQEFVENNKIDLDWWMFSKLDEYLDEICIPYFDGERKIFRIFKPDFIFWLKKNNKYFITFVDPKGIKFKDYMAKIRGYKKFFENDASEEVKVFKYNGLEVRVYLFLFTKDKTLVANDYKEYWIDDISDIFDV